MRVSLLVASAAALAVLHTAGAALFLAGVLNAQGAERVPALAVFCLGAAAALLVSGAYAVSLALEMRRVVRLLGVIARDQGPERA